MGGGAEVVAVGHRDERDAELARPADRLRGRDLACVEREAACASTTHAARESRDTTGLAEPFARPLRRCEQYCGMREAPCEARPSRSARARARAVAAAIGALAPLARNAATISCSSSAVPIRVALMRRATSGRAARA
jgi:hypothetical protein